MLNDMGYEIKTHMSVLEDDVYDKVKKKLSKEKEEIKKKLIEKKRHYAEHAKKGQPIRENKRKKKFSEKKKKKEKREVHIDEKVVAENVKKTLQKLEMGEKRRKKYKKETKHAQIEEESNILHVSSSIPVTELAEILDVKPSEIIKKCLVLGVVSTLNQRIDYDIIEMIADEYGYKTKLLNEFEIKEKEEEENIDVRERPPVVTIMGHVDHGKTSLLDYIRKSHVTATESGGITQHIGAYVVNHNDKKITFIDTPGHEAFTAMRARGANVTDIVVIVVAADDSVMPQTVESINHAKAAGVPIIIAINKVDLPQANPDKVKQDLTSYNVVVEDFGGDVIAVPVSAKTGLGVDELLDAIQLQAELMEIEAHYGGYARGVVLESKIDKGKGKLATILVKKGTLKVNDAFVAGFVSGRVKAMYDEYSRRVKEASPSIPVEIAGFNEVPEVGDVFQVVENEKEARNIARSRKLAIDGQKKKTIGVVSFEQLQKELERSEKKQLNLILKGDVAGSVEALSDVFERLSNEDIIVNVIHKDVGTITESDILLARASNAVIIGFKVKPDAKSRTIAARNKIEIRLYNIIYNAIEDVEKVIKGLYEPEFIDVKIGEAIVRSVFKVSKVGTIAGSYVKEGYIERDTQAKVIREGEEICAGKIVTLKHFTEDRKKIDKGLECGIKIDKCEDIQEGDVIRAFIKEQK
ncbi:MAG: translation initiation factor IF-2 [Proteobacteria bacterium]|nr:translation initiation factor IF-2 [Pseudomonadota bacterium]